MIIFTTLCFGLVCPAAGPSTCHPTALIWSQLSVLLSSSSWPCHDKSSWCGFAMLMWLLHWIRTIWRKNSTHVFSIFPLVQDLWIYYICNPLFFARPPPKQRPPLCATTFLRDHLHNQRICLRFSHVAFPCCASPEGMLAFHRRGACTREVYNHKYICYICYIIINIYVIYVTLPQCNCNYCFFL